MKQVVNITRYRFVGLLPLVVSLAIYLWSFNTQVLAAPQPDLSGAAEPAAAEAVRQYLYGFADGNKPLLQSLMAKKPENYYGPCLFTRLPVLTNPRVERGRALIDFAGEATDPALPREGIIALIAKNHGAGRHWHVRAIFWRGADAFSFNPISASKTAKEIGQEKHVYATAAKYLRSWLNRDWEALPEITYDWLNKTSPLQKEVILRWVKLSPSRRPDGSVRVKFTACVSPRIAVLGLIRRNANGIIYTVKENGEWKIRGITAAL